MTYRAWNLKTLDRAAVRELTHAIAEQNTEELEYHSQSEEPWTEAQYNATLAAQQKETALLAGILAARGITDPTEALTLLAGEEELTDPMLLTDMDKACARILQAIDNEETIVVFGDYDVDGVTATALLYQHLKTSSSPTTICPTRCCPRLWPWWIPAGPTTPALLRACAARAWHSSSARRWTAARRRRCWITAATWPPWARWLT